MHDLRRNLCGCYLCQEVHTIVCLKLLWLDIYKNVFLDFYDYSMRKLLFALIYLQGLGGSMS